MPNTLIPIMKFNRLKVIVKMTDMINIVTNDFLPKYFPNPDARPIGPLVKRKNNPSWGLILKTAIPATINAITPIEPDIRVIR